MESWIVLLSLAVVLPAINGQTCQEVSKCVSNLSGTIEMNDEQGLRNYCEMLSSAIHCMEVVAQDCERQGFDEMTQVVAGSLGKAKQDLMSYCPNNHHGPSGDRSSNSGGPVITMEGDRSVPEDATCGEIMSCVFDTDTFLQAVTDGRLEEACKILSPSVKCLRSATKNCQETARLTAEEMKSATTSLNESERMLQQHCGRFLEKENDSSDPEENDSSDPTYAHEKQDQNENTNDDKDGANVVKASSLILLLISLVVAGRNLI